jgi:hypothetical protein
MESPFNDLANSLKGHDPKVKEKAIEFAIRLMKEKKLNKEDALKEGIKQAENWFIDLEG